ncbi:hypothetical protein CMT20_06875 [Elizabethkingia anophelis]|nr:hypothetical protein [Elizabethkingia anophelis]
MIALVRQRLEFPILIIFCFVLNLLSVLSLKAFQASFNIFQKKNRKKESRYEVLTKKNDQKETE